VAGSAVVKELNDHLVYGVIADTLAGNAGGGGGGITSPKIGNRSVADIAGNTPFRPNQHSVDGSYVERYAKAMREGTFNWSLDKIVIIRAPNGMFIQEGHHRILAAQLAGVGIPESSIKYIDVPHNWDAPVRGWEDVVWSGL